jgi:hypothetical protein
MIVCTEVNAHFYFLISRLKTQIKQLKQPENSTHYNRIKPPIYPKNCINILTSGSIRLELNHIDASPPLCK